MINNLSPIYQDQKIEDAYLSDVAGAANVSPSYIASEVDQIASVSSINNLDYISSLSSSNAGITGASGNPVSFKPTALNRDEQSNYILNMTSKELKDRFNSLIADRFTSGGSIINGVNPGDVRVYNAAEGMDFLSKLHDSAPGLFGRLADTPALDHSSSILQGAADGRALMDAISNLEKHAPHLFPDVKLNAKPPIPSGIDGTQKVENADQYVDPNDPAVQSLLQDLKSQGIITDSMSSDEIAKAVSNYVSKNFTYISDGSVDNWSVVGDTIKRGGGDCEDLAFLTSSLLMAGLIDKGMSYDEANSRVQGVAVNLDSGEGHIFVSYLADDGTTRVLDPTAGLDLSDLSKAPELGSYTDHILFTFNDNSVSVKDGDFDFANANFSYDMASIAGSVNSNTSTETFSDSFISSLYGKLKSQSIIRNGMSQEQVVMAILNYLANTYGTMFDDQGKYIGPTNAKTGFGSWSWSSSFGNNFNSNNVNSFDDLVDLFSKLVNFGLNRLVSPTGWQSTNPFLSFLNGNTDAGTPGRVAVGKDASGHLCAVYINPNGSVIRFDLETIKELVALNPSDPAVTNVVDDLYARGILTKGMSPEEIASTVTKYMQDNYTCVKDGATDKFQTVADSVAKKSGDSADLANLQASVIIAALTRSGMSAEDANNRVKCLVIQLPSGDTRTVVSFRGGGHTQIIDPQYAGSTPLKAGEYKILDVYNDTSVESYNITLPAANRTNVLGGFNSFIWTMIRPAGIPGGNVPDTIKIYSDGDYRIYTGDFNIDHANASADDLSYIYGSGLEDLPPNGSDYDLAHGIENAFHDITEKFDPLDFKMYDSNHYPTTNQARIDALMKKIEALQCTFLLLVMINTTRVGMKGLINELMGDGDAYQGMDIEGSFSKQISLLQKALYQALSGLMKQIRDEAFAIYQKRLKEIKDKHKKSGFDKFVDDLSGKPSEKAAAREMRDEAKRYSAALHATMVSLQKIEVFNTPKYSEAADNAAKMNSSIDKQINSIYDDSANAISNADNGYLKVDNSSLMNNRTKIVGLMNAMRLYVMIVTKQADLAREVNEIMTGAKGRQSSGESIMQLYEIKYARALMQYDQMASAMNAYVSAYNEYNYLKIQVEKLEDSSRSFWDAASTWLGWVPGVGSLINLEDARAVKAVDQKYPDAQPVDTTPYNPPDTRSDTGDPVIDGMNNLNYQEGNILSQVNGGNLLVTTADGMYAVNDVTATMYLDMLTGVQNTKRMFLEIEKTKEDMREIIIEEMTGVSSNSTFQSVSAIAGAQMQNEVTRFSALLQNVIAQKISHNLERQQELMIQRMMEGAINGLYNMIPIIGKNIALEMNINSAVNDPAYGMTLDNPTTAQYFRDKAKASGLTPEDQLEADMNGLLVSLLDNGLVSAGGGALGIDPKLEQQVRDKMEGIQNVLEMLVMLRNDQNDIKAMVQSAYSGVRSRTSGELPNQALQAKFTAMMESLENVLSWLNEAIEVNDRAVEQERTAERYESYRMLYAIATIVEIICLPIDFAITAVIDIGMGIVNHILTQAIEEHLLDEVKQGGMGELSSMPSFDDLTHSSDPLFSALDAQEASGYSNVNKNMISQFSGGQAYLDGGFQATARHELQGIYNVKRLFAELMQGMQDMRNKVNLMMSGIAPQSTEYGETAVSTAEQEAMGKLDGLFRQLQRMVDRKNMIFEAENQYQMAMIQSYISMALSVVKGLLKLRQEALADQMKANDAQINSSGTPETVKQRLIKENANKQKLQNDLEYAHAMLSSMGQMIGAWIEIMHEQQRYNREIQRPQKIKHEGSGRGGKAQNSQQGANESSGADSGGMYGAIDSLDDDSVNFEIDSAGSEMDMAEIDSMMKMWNKLIKMIEENILKVIAGAYTGLKETEYNNKTQDMKARFERSRLEAESDETDPTTKVGQANAGLDRVKDAARWTHKNPEMLSTMSTADILRVEGRLTGRDKMIDMMDKSGKPYEIIKTLTDPVGTLSTYEGWDLKDLFDKTVGKASMGLKLMNLSPEARSYMNGMLKVVNEEIPKMDALLLTMDPKSEKAKELKKIRDEYVDVRRALLTGQTPPQRNDSVTTAPADGTTKTAPAPSVDTTPKPVPTPPSTPKTINTKPLSEASPRELLDALKLLRIVMTLGDKTKSLEVKYKQLAKAQAGNDQKAVETLQAEITQLKADIAALNTAKKGLSGLGFDLSSEEKMLGLDRSDDQLKTDTIDDAQRHQGVKALIIISADIVRELDKKNKAAKPKDRVEITPFDNMIDDALGRTAQTRKKGATLANLPSKVKADVTSTLNNYPVLRLFNFGPKNNGKPEPKKDGTAASTAAPSQQNGSDYIQSINNPVR